MLSTTRNRGLRDRTSPSFGVAVAGLLLSAAACGGRPVPGSSGGGDGGKPPGDPELATWWAGQAFTWYTEEDSGRKGIETYLLKDDGTFTYRLAGCASEAPGFLEPGTWRVNEDGTRVDLLDETGEGPYRFGASDVVTVYLKYLQRSYDAGTQECKVTRMWENPEFGPAPLDLIRGDVCIVDFDRCITAGWGESVYYCGLTPPAEPDLPPCPEAAGS